MGSGTGSIRVGPWRFRGARRRGFRAVSLAAAVGLVAAGLGAPATAVGDTTRRVSVSSTGAQGNDHSLDPAISADGRYVAFSSVASNLVPGDTNDSQTCLSGTGSWAPPAGSACPAPKPKATAISAGPAISADGRYVAFYSYASNLVPGDTNRFRDVFVRDRKLAPPAGSACPAPKPRATAMSASGRRRSVRTAGTSPSVRTRRTWCPVTPTAPPTCSSGTGSGHHPPGQRVQHRSPGQRRQLRRRRSARDGRYVAFGS